MIQNRTKLAIAGTALLALGAVTTYAQVAPTTPAPEATTPAVTAPASNEPMMSLTDIEQLLKGQGLRVTELEVKDRVVEVEAYDSSNREIDLIVDRRTGEILSRQFDR
jgi:hypothetical protein